MDDMTSRDYFAGCAMQAIGHPTLLARIVTHADVPKGVAEACYRIADAMMAEGSRNALEARKDEVATSGSTKVGA